VTSSNARASLYGAVAASGDLGLLAALEVGPGTNSSKCLLTRLATLDY
jgi:hypothetical protein